jgi:hypothetical protein
MLIIEITSIKRLLLICSQIKVEDMATVRDLIATNPSIHIGELSNSDLTDVLDKVRNAINISPREKRRFGLI